jgi:type VI secretion system protein ImpJ
MTDKIARVRWKMGQELLPDHFFAQEEALITDSIERFRMSIERFRMSGLPVYGVADLKWNETLLDEGVFSIQTMILVMPSGLLLDIPGNAVVSPFNLNIPGTVEVAVYCHVLHDTVSDEDIEEEWEVSDQKAIPRVVYQLVLSSEQNHPDAFMTMKLAEFNKAPEGIWQVSDGYIPPLLQTGTSPFLKKELEELAQVLEIFQYNLTLDSASYLSGESLFSVRQCLKSVYRTQRFLANLDSQIHVHPYYVYESLQNLYAEVCFYKNTVPEHITSPYHHDTICLLNSRTGSTELNCPRKSRKPNKSIFWFKKARSISRLQRNI